MKEALELLDQIIAVSNASDTNKEKGGVSWMTHHLLALKGLLEEQKQSNGTEKTT